MTKKLQAAKIAVLVANGFCQSDLTEVQKTVREAGAYVRLISPEQGIVSGWEGDNWGHHFAVDSVLSTSLGADYSMLVIPGGQRSLDKLKLTAHTKRFISSFMASKKPVALFGDALHIMMTTDNLRGRTVNGPVDMMDVVSQASGIWNDNTPCIDENLFSGCVTDESRPTFVAELVEFLSSFCTVKQDDALDGTESVAGQAA